MTSKYLRLHRAGYILSHLSLDVLSILSSGQLIWDLDTHILVVGWLT